MWINKLKLSKILDVSPVTVSQSLRCITQKAKRRLLQDENDAKNTNRLSKPRKGHNRLYAWGLGDTGALGTMKNLKLIEKKKCTIAFHPMRLEFSNKYDVFDIACGYGFSLMLSKNDDGITEVFGTGINSDSQIGAHFNKARQRIELLLYPGPIELKEYLSTKHEIGSIVKCAAGRAHSVFLTDKGEVLTLGNNIYGQCGRPVIPDENYFENVVVHLIPTVGDNEPVESISCGQDHTVLLTQSGKLYSFGWSADGQTGLGNFESAHKPQHIEGDLKHERVVKVACGPDCTLALNDKGDCFGWGNAEYGQFGSDSNHQVNAPRHLDFIKNCGKVVDIASGGSYCLILNEEGEVFVWGFGIIGLGPNVNFTPVPTRIPPTLFGNTTINASNRVTVIRSGLSHMAAINEHHELFTWGRNKYGCLGLSHLEDQYFPLKVSMNAHVRDIKLGADHTLAICRSFLEGSC